MTTLAARTDVSIVGRWWWTVDRWLLAAVLLLLFAGALFSMAASPPVAERIGLPTFHFVKRQLVFVPMALAVLVGVSMLPVVQARRLGVLMFLAFIALTALTLLVGPEIKGSQRWLYLGIFVIQPSEFLKPALIVTVAWVFAEKIRQPSFPGTRIAATLGVASVGLLMLQPDFGQAFLVFMVWSALFFMAGMPVTFIAFLAIAGLGALVAAYSIFPHVASRIDRFLDPTSGDNYQIEKAMDAFQSGGFLGRGPGEGMVKRSLPDAHTDFVFSVVGEEFGLLTCIGLVLLYAFIIVRGFHLLARNPNPFASLAAGGLLVLFGLQSLINIGVNINLLPAKGMTLPFLSYGGSSLLAMSITMGMVLAFTRRSDGLGSWTGGRR